jgi:glycosyltransferase involved in cell wall biosynthesis
MYYLSLLAIFKNETTNLKIWLDHYLWQGVEHFYLVDNGSDDNPLSILQEYMDKGLVTYYYLPEKYKQVQYYQYMFDYNNMKQNTEWLIFCDLDEFFYGVNYKLSKEIKKIEDKYDYILCDWKCFGSGGLITQPPDIRTAIVDCEKNRSIPKYIVKPTAITNTSYIWVHCLLHHTIPAERTLHDNLNIRINHYKIQSLEFFQKIKMTRGDVEHIDKQHIRDMEYFKQNDFKESTDETLKNIIFNPPPFYE